MLNSLTPKSKLASEFLEILAIQKRNKSEVINLVGYVFLSLSLLNLGYLLIHTQFFNPLWEMRTIGTTIESFWAILLGFILIFYRPKRASIKLQEFKNLSRLSWLALLLGIFYLLTIFPLANNGIIIAENNRIQSQQQIQQQTLQLKQFEQQLTNFSDDNLTLFLRADNEGKVAREFPKKLRDRSIETIRQKRDRIEQQLNKQLQVQQMNLIKITVKWTIGAIVSGVFLILIWKWNKSVRMAAIRGERQL